MMFGYGGGWAVLMMIGMLALFGLVIWAVYALATGGARRGEARRVRLDGPREVLDGRLARGEISTDEYRERLEVLTPRHR